MKRTLLFLLCALMSTQMFSETLFGYLFPTLAYLERTSCHYMEGNEQNRTLNRLKFQDNMFEIDGNYYIEYNGFWLREDEEGRILVYSHPTQKDLVLYDFTLEVGDTLTTLNADEIPTPVTEGDPISSGVKYVVVDYPIYINGELSCPIDTLIVTDVSMVMMCDSNEYKKWTFSNGMEYMEYIGNLGADFFPIIRNPWEDVPTCCVEEHLVCASIYDRLVYLMDDEKRDLLNIDCPCTSWSNKWQWRTNTWNVLQFDGMAFEQTAQTWQYKLAHDTIIGGKEYTAVTRHWTAYDESAAEYVAAVRFTENKKAYIYYDNAEYLLYDFGYHEIGDTLEVFSGINNYMHFKTYKCVITDNYSTAGGIAEDTYVMDIIDPIIGNTIPSAMIWEEFIGSYSGFLHGGLLVPGNSNYQLLCAYKDNTLAYSVDNDAFTDNDTFIEYGCEYNAEQKPKDLFPTLWGLQRTGCTKTIGENGNGTTVWGSRSYLMQGIGNTIIDGKQYLLFGINDIYSYDEYCSLWLREENNKILVYSAAQKKDLVLYDFTLNVGDSLPRLYVDEELSSIVDYFKYEADREYTKPLFVTEVSTITLLDGKEYKKWTFDNGIEYVEGIGSFGSNYGHNDFYQLIVNAPRFSDVYSQHLVCASKNGQLLYKMDESEMAQLETGCLCEAENPEDLFPTLTGLQRTEVKVHTTGTDAPHIVSFDEYTHYVPYNKQRIYLTNDGLTFLREENNQVLFYAPSYGIKEDVVLYDWTLEVGDTLPYNKYTLLKEADFIVTNVSTITLLDGKEYKKWTLACGIEYIEGIGAINGGGYGNYFCLQCSESPAIYIENRLVCASRNGQLLYQMDDAEMERLGAECLCDYDRGPLKDNAKNGKIGGRPTPTQWNQLELDLREMENGNTILRAETFSYTLENDSIVANGKTYYQLARQSTKDTATTKSFVGALHFGEDEDNRVYFLRDGVEYVLYDFTAEPGDTIEIFAGINNYPQDSTYTHVVTGKDTLENGACRMLLEVFFPDETATAENAEKVWLAGLGSVDGIVHNAATRATTARSSDTQTSVMLCAWRDDNCLYTTDHPDYNTLGCVYNIDEMTSVEDTHSPLPMTDCYKLLRNGQLLIIHKGKTYNVLGVPVE